MTQNVRTKNPFHIPSLQEMENSKSPTLDAKSTFAQFRYAKQSPDKIAASRLAVSQVNKVGPPQQSSKSAPSSSSEAKQNQKTTPTAVPISTPSSRVTTCAEPVVVQAPPALKNCSSSTSMTVAVPAQPAVTAATSSASEVRNTVSVSRDDGGSKPEHTSVTSLESAGVPTSGKSGATGALIVSNRQRGNPLLKHIRNVPWEHGDIVADYVMGANKCALFLSFRYHALNPNYIHERLKQLGHSYDLRVLLAQIDVKDPHHTLKELAKICILADCTLILAWSPEEAGRYLETYKSYENKPADLIMEKTDANFVSRVTDCLTTVKKVNKTDAGTLLSTFETIEDIFKASEEDIGLCPGIGPQKAKRLHDVIHEPFLRSKKKKLESMNTDNSGSKADAAEDETR